VTRAITINIKSMAKEIHKGDVTHHQDQSIWLVNFNTKNIKNNIGATLFITIEDDL
jgi:hypothetical protein